MNLHHATLKAAVKAYGALLTEGKSEAEVRAAIAADEKEFTTEQVDEIYEAITADPTDGPEAAKQFLVKTQFRDKDNFNKLYEVGDDVSHFDEARKADLVGRGLIEAKDQE